MTTRMTRQLEAVERQQERDERSDDDQLKRLRASGHGHCKEALMLTKRITKREKS